MISDLRFGWRMLWRNPGFTLMAAVALALGIGANTAIFSVVNAVMLERLPFPNPDQLVMVWEANPSTPKPNVVNGWNFAQWQERNHSFDQMAAFVSGPAALSGDGEPAVVDYISTTADFFRILGVKPLLGRWFEPGEDRVDHANEVILSEGLWRRRYGADPNIIGKIIRVDTAPDKVVGVMPASFHFPQMKADLWEPRVIDRTPSAPGRYLSVIARLRPGVTKSGAQAEVNVLASQLQRERPDFDSKWGIDVVGLHEQAVGDARTPLLVLLGAVGLVLLIACAYVANLMLMRAAGRGREIAVRAALGASAIRIARQLLVESTMLSVFGGALGLLIGTWAVRILSGALPYTYSNLKEIRIDAPVFLFALGISIATGILFGLAPAIKAARTDVQTSLKGSGRGLSSGRSFGRSVLVVAEVALSMILLIGAGLLIRSFTRLSSVDPGFEVRHVISMNLAPWGQFKNRWAMVEFTQQVIEQVRSLPGVQAAGTTHFLPLTGGGSATWFWRADEARPEHGAEQVTDVAVVMPGYFAAMNIPILRGRVFDNRDRQGSSATAVINQTVARQLYPNEDPVGKQLTVSWDHPEQPYEIVGVVADVRQRGLNRAAEPMVFLSMAQAPQAPITLVTRAQGDPALLVNAIQARIHAINPNVALFDVKTMDSIVRSSVAPARFNMILLAGFAGLALILAAVGIFGVISYSVAQRTREIGIRRALGEETSSILRSVLLQAMTLTGVGILVGIAGAFAVTRLLQTLLFGVTAMDPTTFAAVAALLGMVAALASYLPARRAAKVDPVVALRYE